MTASRLPALLFLFATASGAQTAMPATDGARLYRQHCSACHGHDGTGGVGVPLALPAFLASVDDPYLNRTIRLGRPGRVMPAFTQLADAEVAAPEAGAGSAEPPRHRRRRGVTSSGSTRSRPSDRRR